jgi:dihydrofolate reductase
MPRMRARCSVFIATSLDGFIARRDGAIDWLSIVERPGEDYGYARFMQSIDALVVGRKTYETALGFDAWPYAGKRSVVLTHGHPTPKHGEEIVSEPLDALVDRLSREGVKRIYVDGGSTIRQFLAANLVDDLTLSIVPILLGDGIPLFGGIARELRLAPVETRRFESGLVQLEYQLGPRSGS